MPFPDSWPPRPATGVRSVRFYVTGTATADFSDNAFIFADQVTANPFLPTPYVPPGGARVLTQVGNTLITGSPMGGGENVHDMPPPAMLWCRAFQIHNESGAGIEFSFDGVTVQGFVPPNSVGIYFDRYEAGIAIRGAGVFRLEAY